ncbi:MAG: hypothetical protein EXS08_16960 [Planctomycetes bacterium]|nr:hypothetical protein [Planctomycetota bacterium]
MDLDAFRASLDESSPPSGLTPCLTALWLDARGDWDGAHALVQELEGEDPAWIHAYLHRKEGDRDNAAYWYERTGRALAAGSFQAEWRVIASALLEQ